MSSISTYRNDLGLALTALTDAELFGWDHVVLSDRTGDILARIGDRVGVDVGRAMRENVAPVSLMAGVTDALIYEALGPVSADQARRTMAKLGIIAPMMTDDPAADDGPPQTLDQDGDAEMDTAPSGMTMYR